MKGRQIEYCALCLKKELGLLWDLPSLPLTEKYGSFSPNHQLFADQTLLHCDQCGHVQLGFQIDPTILYSPSEYSFRTASSQTAMKGTSFFHEFFMELSRGRTFKSLMDVGGNGCYLAKMAQNVEKKCVVDPICVKQDGKEVDGIRMFGRFVEHLDFEKEGLKPDLIFSRHVLEHVAQPREVLQQLLRSCDEQALYIFEIPCLEQLIEANRFDAVFHQHYHYFDLSSFKNLLQEVGAEYIAHRYHRQGSCGGALLIAFKKGSLRLKQTERKTIEQRKRLIIKAIEQYQQQMKLMQWQLEQFSAPIYGYGASLMLATLGYHLQTDFSQLVCILDDDEQKDGISYKNVPVHVQSSSLHPPEENAGYLITSLENVRGIYRNITSKYKPRRVFIPIVS